MKFDHIIIGGGLSGLTCGIKLAEQGRKCAIISSGQSALHFFSGSFDLLSNVNGTEVENPLEAMDTLPQTHPYQRLGRENAARLAKEAPQLLKRCGLNFMGAEDKNHYVLTPMGTMRPTWLSLNDFTRFEQKDELPWKKVVILNFAGFLDFHALFVKDGLSAFGVEAEIHHVVMDEFEAIRRNPSEMRSSNIAKVFDRGAALDGFTRKVNLLSRDADAVVLPAVFGSLNTAVTASLQEQVEKPLVLLPALPPSVPGIRTQILLKQRFHNLGGTYFLGDKVEEGTIQGNRLHNITTTNHGNIKLEADQFVLASGSFYSKGIVASPYKVYEPIFGLDVDAEEKRTAWFDKKIFKDQPFMHYGVQTDQQFRAVVDGQPVENLYVAGSVLSGANPLKEGSGAGICLLTSLHVAENIL